MRVFVALNIPDEHVLDSIVSFQREVASTGSDVKIVERQNLHFTMKFLGEISESQASEADRRLRGLRLDGGEVTVEGVGAFPSVSKPSIVWVGVSPPDESKVESIAKPVLEILHDLGERDDRPFRAHLTIVRVKSRNNLPELSSTIRANSSKTFGKVRLADFRLKSSRLTPAGPVYRDIGVYPLS